MFLRRRGLRRSGDNIEQRAIRAEDIRASWRVVSCQASAGGSRSCPREPNHAWMLSEMRSRRLANPREPMPTELTNFVPPRVFELDESKFNRNLRSSRRGAAAGLSGMTMEYLRPLLDDQIIALVLLGRRAGCSRSGP